MPPLRADLDSYVQGHREAELERARVARERCREIRARLPALVALLAGEYGATRIVLFGSVARGEPGPGSDVDVLVEGMDRRRYFEAAAEASRILDADVDLVPAETAHPGVLTRALTEGEILHE